MKDESIVTAYQLVFLYSARQTTASEKATLLNLPRQDWICLKVVGIKDKDISEKIYILSLSSYIYILSLSSYKYFPLEYL